MNIGFITEISGKGGGETSLLYLMDSLRREGHNTFLICPPGPLLNMAERKGIAVCCCQFPDLHLRFGLLPAFSIQSILYIYQLIKKYHLDILQAESYKALFYGGIAAKLTRIPLVATYHGYWPLHGRWNLAIINLFCQKIFPVSKNVENDLCNKLKGCLVDMETVYLGYDQAFSQCLASKQEAREELRLPQNASIILQVARFQTVKGQHYLLGAFREVLKVHFDKNPILLYVGGVLNDQISSDIDYRKRVIEEATQGDVRDRVFFWGERNDIPLIMRAADMLVVPSEFETFSMVTIEAMVAGLPVIATAAGGPTELIEHMMTGLLVPPQDVNSMVKGICWLLENPEASRQISANARIKSEKNYSVEKRTQKLLKEYFGLLCK